MTIATRPIENDNVDIVFVEDPNAKTQPPADD